MPRELARYAGFFETLEMLKFYAPLPPEPESIPVVESYGRVVSEDLVSTVDIPLGPRSRVDGFAIRADDIIAASTSNPVEMSILKRGDPSESGPSIEAARASPIRAGDILPRGTDTVLDAEEVLVSSVGIVVSAPRGAGELVDSAGAEIKMGATIARRGTLLRVQEIGMLASIGLGRVRVFQTPRLVVLPTVEDGSSEVVHATSGALALLVASAGGSAIILNAVPDDSKLLLAALNGVLADAEIIMLIADPSDADPDPVEGVINSFGKPGLVVRGIKIEPGRTTGFGMAKGKPVIVVPRRMLDAISSFVVLTYPLIRTMLGQPFGEPPQLIATLSEDWQAVRRFQNFAKVVSVNLWDGPEGLVAKPLELSPASTTIPADANGYAMVPESLTSLRKGTKVSVHLLPGFSYAEARFL